MNLEATRLAFKMAHWAPEHLGYVKFTGDGCMYATDGIAMVASVRSHNLDIEEPLFVRLDSSPTFSKSAEGFYLNLDNSVLVEERPRSDREYPISIFRGIKYPLTENQVPGRLGVTTQSVPPFDSIRAGKIASEYGLEIGVWGRGVGDDRVYLKEVQPTDTVILASIRNGTLS